MSCVLELYRSTQLTRLHPETSRWDRPVANLQVSSNPLCMTLHAYDPHLVIANDTDMIRFVRCVLVNGSVLTVLQRLGLVPTEAVELLLQWKSQRNRHNVVTYHQPRRRRNHHGRFRSVDFPFQLIVLLKRFCSRRDCAPIS